VHDITHLKVFRYDEQVVIGKPLGRYILHDSRSLQYLTPQRSIATQLWKRQIPIFDQGNLGSCTTNAGIGTLGSDPYYTPLLYNNIQYGEQLCVSLYHEETMLDPYPGTYPPDDTGSDGLSCAKVLKNHKWISGYVHALDLPGAQSAIQTGPFIMGLDWYDSFDNPASDGTIKISKDAQVRGGHEVEVLGMDLDTEMFRAVNSWSDMWGDKGYFQFSFDTFSQLMAQDGDVVSFVPNTQPAPVPTPTPAPTPVPPPVDWIVADTTFANQAHTFLNGHHFFYKSFQKDVQTWLTAKDL
jgi:hypothetical protein